MLARTPSGLIEASRTTSLLSIRRSHNLGAKGWLRQAFHTDGIRWTLELPFLASHIA